MKAEDVAEWLADEAVGGNMRCGNKAAAAMAVYGLLAERDRLREALEIIAGRRQCLDNLMSNQEVAIAALDRKP